MCLQGRCYKEADRELGFKITREYGMETIRSAQVTMMTNMVGHAEDVVVRDTDHAVVENTHTTSVEHHPAKGIGIGLRLGLLLFLPNYSD